MEKQQAPAAVKEDLLPPQSADTGGCLPITSKAVGEAFERLRRRANDGDAQARAALARYLDAQCLWNHFGDLGRHVELAIVEAAAGGEWLTSEAVKREAERMRRELAGPAPTPLEMMAVERIVVTWLQLQHTEMRFLQSQKDLGWAKYWLRRQEQADKLYRAAIGSLVLIRALLPTPAPASVPAIADACAEATKPETGDMVEPLIPAEILTGGGLGANRIAHLVAYPENTQRLAADGQADAKPKTNGHHHRLEELLANHGS
jgi:hypothetical protein